MGGNSSEVSRVPYRHGVHPGGHARRKESDPLGPLEHEQEVVVGVVVHVGRRLHCPHPQVDLEKVLFRHTRRPD